MNKYIKLKDLDVYKLARNLSHLAWSVYEKLDWQDKKVIGDQFIQSADSVGANIAEGYGRFHYLDSIKFYYNARASFFEAYEHWLELLCERGKIKKETFEKIKGLAEKLSIKLNNFITATYNAKEKEQ